MDPQIRAFLETGNPRGARDLSQVPLDEALAFVRQRVNRSVDFTGLTVETKDVSAGGASVRVRTYVADDATGPLPVVLNFHGGGFVLGVPEMDDFRCVELARTVGCGVVSVDYRLAPEHKFPAAIDDALTALTWLRNSADPVFDTSRIVTIGSSAGGTIAACLALRNRDLGGAPLAAQVLIYPVCDDDFSRDSYRLYSQGYYLTADRMRWYLAQYNDPAAVLDRAYYLPMRAQNHTAMPRSLILVAGFDPLADEARAYADLLKAAGTEVLTLEVSDGVHGFVNAAPEASVSRVTLETIASYLRQTFAGAA